VTLTFAVLGDSIAWGQGASRPGDRPAALLAEALTAEGIDVDLRMFAVPGARSDGLAAQVDRALAARPGLVLLVIGANDLTHFVPPGAAANQLGAAVTTLRAAAAQVVVVPAPDLSVVPWLPAAARPLVHTASLALQRAQTRAALAAGAIVVDLAAGATSFGADPTLYSADRFHPSSAGYAVIAAGLTPAVLAAARRANA
jgi:lysophospholipase L1-like esterase